MSRFDMLYEARRVLERAVDLDDLVAALFEDCPDLNSFRYSVTNEYDDNNYSDYSRLVSVNGWNVDYDGAIEEDQDEDLDVSTQPAAGSIDGANSLSDMVQIKYGVGEFDFDRKDYEYKSAEQRMKDNADADCAAALIKGDKVPVDTLAKADFRWALWHAEVHGRYSPEDEFKVFAREGGMYTACEYAEKFGQLSEKTLNWFILSSQKDDADHKFLQHYLQNIKAA